MRITDLNTPAVQAGLVQLFSLMKSILSEKHFRLLGGICDMVWTGQHELSEQCVTSFQGENQSRET